MDYFDPATVLRYYRDTENEDEKTAIIWKLNGRAYEETAWDSLSGSALKLFRRDFLGYDVLSYAADGDVFRIALRRASLEYVLAGPVEKVPAPRGWPKRLLGLRWLCDEISRSPSGSFVHCILLGDGVELRIPFSSVAVTGGRRTPPKGMTRFFAW